MALRPLRHRRSVFVHCFGFPFFVLFSRLTRHRLRTAALGKLHPRTRASVRSLQDDEFADSRVLDSYRAKRVAELKALAAKNKFGEVSELRDCVRTSQRGARCWRRLAIASMRSPLIAHS
jgi:hypothetical protein